MPAKSLELKHTIKLIGELDSEIDEIESEILIIMNGISSPILTISRIGFRMATIILAEVGNFSRFDSPNKLLAYAGISPSTYQSGQMESSYFHTEKRGSRYLHYALINATNMSVCGIRLLRPTLQRSGRRACITMSPSLTPRKNWCGSFTQ